MQLSDVKALITGGSSGIGYETARQLVNAGAKVAICGRGKEKLDAAASDLGVLAIQADVGMPEDVDRMVDQVIKEFDGFNVLVNNAAFGYFAPLTEIDLEQYHQMMNTNLTGALLVGQRCARHFVDNSSGTILNISSTAGLKGFPGGSPYVASKFALKGMTQCWAQELRKHDVRVTLINPSEVVTNFANSAGYQQEVNESKLRPGDIAHSILSAITMEDRGFIPELTVWATNPK